MVVAIQPAAGGEIITARRAAQAEIGWALRQYARTDPKAVKEFVKETKDLHPLSRREAMKHLEETEIAKPGSW